jgi:hypothetical protein
MMGVNWVSAAELAVNEKLLLEATIKQGIASRPRAILRLTVEVLPERPIVPLRLEVSIVDAARSPERQHLVTFSLFGILPGQTTTLVEPLPRAVMTKFNNGKTGKLPLELYLSSSGKPEVSAQARVRITSATVEADDSPPTTTQE